MTKRRFVRAAAALAAVAASVIIAASAGAGTAKAGTGWGYWPTTTSVTSSSNGWTNIRNWYCTTASWCYIIKAVPNGTAVYKHCWVDGQNAFGNYWSVRWFYVTTADGSTTGFIHSSLIPWWSQVSTPGC